MEPEVFDRAKEEFHRLVDQRLTKLDSWTRGHFTEALVASLLDGAVVSDHGVAPCDVTWGPISIAVRATGSRSTDHFGVEGKAPFGGSWRFPVKSAWDSLTADWDPAPPRRCWANVAVLAFHDGFDIAEGWCFYVLSQAHIESFPSVALTPRSLERSGVVSVAPDQLASEVLRVAG